MMDDGCILYTLLSKGWNKLNSDVRHPHCVLYNSKELGVLILTVEHNYICLYYYKEDYNNDMFIIIEANIVVFDCKF